MAEDESKIVTVILCGPLGFSVNSKCKSKAEQLSNYIHIDNDFPVIE